MDDARAWQQRGRSTTSTRSCSSTRSWSRSAKAAAFSAALATSRSGSGWTGRPGCARDVVPGHRRRQVLDAGPGAPRGATESSGGERPPSSGRRSDRVEAEGSRTWETPGTVASGPDNDGTGRHCQTAWVRQARQKGVREEPVLSRPSMHPSAPIWRIRAEKRHNPAAARTAAGTLGSGQCDGPGGHEEGLRRTCGWPQGYSWAPTLSIDSVVNVGTVPSCPAPVGGQARRLPVAAERGGAAVLVRAGESPVHGEGRQQDRGGRTGRLGGRR